MPKTYARAQPHTHTQQSQRVPNPSFSIMRISLSRKYPEAICCIVLYSTAFVTNTHHIASHHHGTARHGTQVAMHFRIFILFYSFPFRRFSFFAHNSSQCLSVYLFLFFFGNWAHSLSVIRSINFSLFESVQRGATLFTSRHAIVAERIENLRARHMRCSAFKWIRNGRTS